MARRLPPQPGEWIDREHTVRFTFEGREYPAFAGDTISSALLANGVRVLGRSFKYHRPRGVFSAANHDTNVLFQSETDFNIRGDVTAVEDGMKLAAVNTAGGVKRDRGRIMDSLSPMLPVGFYYKTFHRPRALFPFWEKRIRSMAGLGRVDTAWNGGRVPKRHAFCDLLVVGAGPSGLSAAVAAAEAGVNVWLVDENARPGGSFNDQEANLQRDELLHRAHELHNLTILTDTVAAGWYADHYIPLVTPEALIRLRARAVIVAAGVYEQPAVFRNNDLPGVMLGNAARRLVHRYGVAPCESTVILAGNSDAYRSALELQAAGVAIRALLDLEDPGTRADLFADVQAADIPVYGRCAVHSAEGNGILEAVTVCELDGEGRAKPDTARRIDCDGLLMSVGYAPAAALLYQSGAGMTFAGTPGQFVPESLPPGVFACGRVNGVFGLQARLDDGLAAAGEALAYLGRSGVQHARPGRGRERMSHPWPVFPHPKGKVFVDLDEDLQLKDLERAAAEGFDNIELLKRYSTVGMGPSQGKHANMNAVRILARLTGRTIDRTGTTTARPFHHPVPVGHLAGRRLRPERRTAMHGWHKAHGAVFMPAGHWLRPKYYGPGPEEEAIRAEVLAVREGVAMVDVSTLGKVEVIGPDAARFMDQLYTLKLSTVKIGRTRYALMVDEAGVIIDDGVCARWADDHFYVTTTTTGAEIIFRHMQRLIGEWQLNVDVINRTHQMASMNIAGPLTREVLQPLTDLDLSQEAFPYLGARQALVAGVPAWLFRVGFVGELGYEIHVPSAQARHVWVSLMAAGEAYGIRPFGVEAQRQLRLEKAHLIVGQDTDGTSSPFDANMNWAVKFDKPFFQGKRSLEILKERASNRLLGFRLPGNHPGPVPEECHLVIHDGDIAGRVTSIGYSPSLDAWVGLAMVDRALEDADTLSIRAAGAVMVDAPVVPTPFYDPEGLRQKLETAHEPVAREASA
ncbi:aminomethyltransferase [Thioalkalivibrio denitrificans]|uniref:Aminomethyltransferase n=1 Tax=Thioalkalivibrio denitrificans TaxID=108003 RepID=A0A1V3NMW0_9GAMM|nr:2Fe-2S iron-sulfur cluster-binding protein [Thioalkalivibrio denitrificans]OOG26415.1 aminomethyltransferase [Thioalkalivibrio denitrificans]